MEYSEVIGNSPNHFKSLESDEESEDSEEPSDL